MPNAGPQNKFYDKSTQPKSSPELYPDNVLWDNFRSGNEESLVLIFERYSGILFAYGRNILADRDGVKDCIQDLFVDLWKNKANLGPTDSIRFYLLKSLRNRLIRYKRKSMKLLFGLISEDPKGMEEQSCEFVLIAEQMALENNARLMSAIGKLSRRQREALYLRYFDNLSYDQISEIMKISRQRLYNLVNEGISALRTSLK